ncbi:coatomer subunit delta [Gregarina niphandrodes]|uniref:Coatomer subunit delta n=1 Tax=Gregarina niphandrodes TaxID=110365 RepID=A0A023B994_GRENI|nr:coatomer subunit delta [Gregarina niphandrodes]EZG71576.1 coatomer subunit delta [Gregarina niphandrodes]|eukprot:XP_011129821.1 coatomer subunit delta [Gregarina niphandrodes]
MVVLCAAIVSKTGPLVSRQYVPIDKLRLEALLSRFITVVATNPDKTSIETDNVRFLYVPIGGLYAVLITDLVSNIILDFDTLRVMQHTLLDLCQSDYRPENILKLSYDLLFAFDELISPGGFHEYVTEENVQELCTMESAAERLQVMLAKAKEHDEIERRRKKGIQLDQERLRAAAAARAAQRG